MRVILSLVILLGMVFAIQKTKKDEHSCIERAYDDYVKNIAKLDKEKESEVSSKAKRLTEEFDAAIESCSKKSDDVLENLHEENNMKPMNGQYSSNDILGKIPNNIDNLNEYLGI